MRALDLNDHPYDVYHIASDSCPTLGEMVDMIKSIVPNADISIGPGTYKHAGTVDIPNKGALNCDRARAAFGYRPQFDLAKGLAAYAEDFKNKKQGEAF